jgi:putative acetyltransferase
MRLKITEDDLCGLEIAAFLREHIDEMKAVSPPESKHALDLDGLKKPEITFWTVWDGAALVGCGALKELTATHAELKSMRVAASHRGQGIASALLEFIVDEATRRGYERISLETGSAPYFVPAIRLYDKFGFVPCPPFADYKEDPHSVFMTKVLDESQNH